MFGKAKQAKEQKLDENKVDHTNPFNKGVTYESFLEATKGEKIEDVLKAHKCSELQIRWIQEEVKNYNAKNK